MCCGLASGHHRIVQCLRACLRRLRELAAGRGLELEGALRELGCRPFATIVTLRRSYAGRWPVLQMHSPDLTRGTNANTDANDKDMRNGNSISINSIGNSTPALEPPAAQT